MRGTWIAAVLCALAAIAGLPAWAQERRVALVIGNGQYRHIGRLANPANDARAMALALDGAGFSLIGGGPQIDLDKPGMERALRSFGRELGPDAVGLFFFAGHGIAVREVNYLVPVEANPQRESDVDFDLVDSRIVLRQMADAGNRLNMLILDACRNNPLAGRGFRSAGAGLVRMEAPAGTLIHYATAPGKVAADGTGANSPYTEALVETLRQPGLGVMDVFNQVGLKVMQRTKRTQEPWLALSPIQGQFQFVPAAAGAVAAGAPVRPQVAALPPPSEVALDPIDREYVAKEAARVRGTPDVRGQQVATLREGDAVLVLGKVKGQEWYQIERSERGKRVLGYVAAGLLEEGAVYRMRKAEEEKQAARQQAMVAPAPVLAAPPAGALPAPGRSFRDCPECPEMVAIPRGSTTMGEGTVWTSYGRQRVSIGYLLAVGKNEVTFAEWDACVSAGGCSHQPDDGGWGRGNRPVMRVSWDDAKQYAAWLSRRTGRPYRLLTEAEWEYAARAGRSGDVGGERELKGRNLANCDGCGSQWDNRQTAPAGSFGPNGFGLHDMLGNVWEWVEDCWNERYGGGPTNGQAWNAGDCSRRVLRGGSRGSGPDYAHASGRGGSATTIRGSGIGFRVARTQ